MSFPLYTLEFLRPHEIHSASPSFSQLTFSTNYKLRPGADPLHIGVQTQAPKHAERSRTPCGARRLILAVAGRGAAAAPSPPQQHNHVTDDLPVPTGRSPGTGWRPAEMAGARGVPAVLPQVVVLCHQRHEGIDEAAAAAAAASSTSGLVSKWRPKDRVMDVMQFADAVSSASSDIILGNSLDSVTPGLRGS